MKLLYILPILVGLTACSDKPVFVQNGFFCNGAEESNLTTDIKLYKNYAIISVNGENIKLEKKTIIQDDTMIEYSNNDYKLEFMKFHGGERLGGIRIGFYLNNHKCFFAETEADDPHQHLQTKEIDEKTQKELERLFK